MMLVPVSASGLLSLHHCSVMYSERFRNFHCYFWNMQFWLEGKGWFGKPEHTKEYTLKNNPTICKLIGWLLNSSVALTQSTMSVETKNTNHRLSLSGNRKQQHQLQVFLYFHHIHIYMQEIHLDIISWHTNLGACNTPLVISSNN